MADEAGDGAGTMDRETDRGVMLNWRSVDMFPVRMWRMRPEKGPELWSVDRETDRGIMLNWRSVDMFTVRGWLTGPELWIERQTEVLC